MKGSHAHRAIGLHEDAACARAVDAFVEIRGESGMRQRAEGIAALASKEWRGTRVFEVRCEGPYGRGPHVQWVPERVLWGLIDLSHFLCPFHR